MVSSILIIFIIFLNVSQFFAQQPLFEIPAPSDKSTSDPYQIYLVNTFPLESQTLDLYDHTNLSSYLDLVDQKVGTPFYAGKDISKSREFYVKSFFQHSRTLDSIKKTYTAGEKKCQTNSNSKVPNNRKIISIFHEINIPFEVPCFSCQKSSLSNPNFFRVITNRDVSAIDLLSQSMPIYKFIEEKAKNEGEAQIFAGDIVMENPGLGGSFRSSPKMIPEKSSYNETLGRYNDEELLPRTKVKENSMSLFCSKELNGTLQSPEIIVNVDTLKIPPKNELVFSKDEIDLFSTEGSHRFTIGDLTVWENYKKNIILPINNEKFNLKLDIFWEEWSCCSACCCSAITCGNGFDTSSLVCGKIKSQKNRRGFLSFFKNDSRKPLNILKDVKDYLQGTNLYDETIVVVVKTFELYLSSSSSYAIHGIPVHSTLLQSDRSWLILETFLNKHFHYRDEANSNIGQLGVFIDSQSCENYPQKHNCTLLQKCFDNQSFDVTAATTLPPTPQVNSDKPPNGNECGFGAKDIAIEKTESVIEVDEKSSYRLFVQENMRLEPASIQWKKGQTKIREYDPTRACGNQKIHVDGKFLKLLKITKKDFSLPFVIQGKKKLTGQTVTLKVTLHVKEKAPDSKYTNHILKWVGIAGGVLVVFICIVVVVHIIQVRSLKRKLQAAAPVPAKTNEQI